MIQDIAPSKLYNEFLRAEVSDLHELKDDSRILIFEKREIFVDQDLQLPTYKEWNDWFETIHPGTPVHNGISYGPDFELRYLFSINNVGYFLFFTTRHGIIRKDLIGNNLSKFHWENLRLAMSQVQETGYAIATGFHLYTWYRKHRLCGCCGTPLVHDSKERMLRCPECGNVYFPMIAPACIIAVTNGNKEHPQVLLSKYANREYTRYALLAGFIEIGETAEEAVKREVFEEVGLKVKNIRYYKSQPWGIDSNLLLGFFCELDQEDEIVIDKDELALAEWKDPCDVPTGMGKLSLTGEMMEVFVRENS